MKFYQLIILIDLGVRWRNHPQCLPTRWMTARSKFHHSIISNSRLITHMCRKAFNFSERSNISKLFLNLCRITLCYDPYVIRIRTIVERSHKESVICLNHAHPLIIEINIIVKVHKRCICTYTYSYIYMYIHTLYLDCTFIVSRIVNNLNTHASKFNDNF